MTIIGVDQGASKTHAVVGNASGNLLGFGTAQGACHTHMGIPTAMDAVRGAVYRALDSAGLVLADVDILFVGMTGMDWPEEEPLLLEALRSNFPVPQIHVVNDCIVAMRAGSDKGYGAVLCAGSGLNCAVRTRKGQQYIYGFYIDDCYQGGSALGAAAVQAVFDAHAGLLPKTQLTRRVLDTLGYADVDDMMKARVAGELPISEYLRLPIPLEDAALENDAVAIDIYRRFGEKWAEYAGYGMQRLGIADTPADVVLSGSIFKCREHTLLNAVQARLAEMAPGARLVQAGLEPVVGALLLGLDAAGCTVNTQNEALRAGARRHSLLRY